VLPGYVKKARFLRGHAIDLVHLNNAANRGYDWIAACRTAGVKCITHNRGDVRLSLSDRFFVRRFDAIVSIAEFLRDDLRRQGVGGERSVVINDGIDPGDVMSRVCRSPVEVRRGLGISPDDPLIGIVGNIREWKGQDVVVRALHLLASSIPGLRCLVIGGVSETRSADLDYKHSIEAFIAGHGLEERVLFLGYRDDVPDLVNSLDILVHASVSPEPFGRVILEGMVLGRPVVATNIGGPREIIEDGISGLLVPPDDPPALASAIGWLLSDGALRERVAGGGVQRAAERFHISRYMERVHELYERLTRCRTA
jgi:glycosyltransferase involved in cell wall biosynthesis